MSDLNNQIAIYRWHIAATSSKTGGYISFRTFPCENANKSGEQLLAVLKLYQAKHTPGTATGTQLLPPLAYSIMLCYSNDRLHIIG